MNKNRNFGKKLIFWKKVDILEKSWYFGKHPTKLLFQRFDNATDNPAASSQYYNDIYKLNSSSPYDLRSYTSARQFDEILAPLFFSYDIADATNYKAGIHMMNGITLGTVFRNARFYWRDIFIATGIIFSFKNHGVKIFDFEFVT